MRYILIKELEQSDLENSVNKKLAEGYELVGGISVGLAYFYQALVKKED
jgi:hypothetical protein